MDSAWDLDLPASPVALAPSREIGYVYRDSQGAFVIYMRNGIEIRTRESLPGLFESQITRGEELLSLLASRTIESGVESAITAWRNGWD